MFSSPGPLYVLSARRPKDAAPQYPAAVCTDSLAQADSASPDRGPAMPYSGDGALFQKLAIIGGLELIQCFFQLNLM